MRPCTRTNCPRKGPGKGTHCRADQGFKFTSDDWCNCLCHHETTCFCSGCAFVDGSAAGRAAGIQTGRRQAFEESIAAIETAKRKFEPGAVADAAIAMIRTSLPVKTDQAPAPKEGP